ncbi:MAG: hypothetical protein DRN14_02525 [Thermoplasmata archaeon]|nr:MAG: hypothetical protein DRN14_02525 [Thermoplasmata archaeon]
MLTVLKPEEQAIMNVLLEFIVREIEQRQDYTWVWEGAPLRMYLLSGFEEEKWIAVLTGKQAHRLSQMAEVKKGLRSDEH